MTAEQLSQYAGVLLQLALAYIPGVSDWYQSKDSKAKAGIMAVLLLAVAGAIYAASCVGLAGDFGVSCDTASAFALVKIYIAALIANQSTFLIGVRPFVRKG